eukprot:scaffold65587_cov19-Tisochrysis_lutea.AAC.2
MRGKFCRESSSFRTTDRGQCITHSILCHTLYASNIGQLRICDHSNNQDHNGDFTEGESMIEGEKAHLEGHTLPVARPTGHANGINPRTPKRAHLTSFLVMGSMSNSKETFPGDSAMMAGLALGDVRLHDMVKPCPETFGSVSVGHQNSNRLPHK